MKEYFKKLITGVLFVLPMFLLPLSAHAEEKRVEVDSWYELKEALEAEEAMTILVPGHVAIQCTYDSEKQEAEDYQVSVKGEKVLELYGKVVFENTVNDETGLICLWDEGTKLTIKGTGSFTYVLDHYVSGDIVYIEHGNLFYLSGGTLTVEDDVVLKVSAAWLPVENYEFHQAVFAGVRGKVIINGGIFFGNTIYSRGINWEINHGYFDCSGGDERDIRFESGDVVLKGGTFLNGIVQLGGKVSLAPDCYYIRSNGELSETVINNAPGFVYEPGFDLQEPKGLEDEELVGDLGTITEGESCPIRFKIKNDGYRYQDWGFEFVSELAVRGSDSDLVYTDTSDNDVVEYDLKNLKSGEYDLTEEAIVIKNDKVIHRYTNRFHVKIEQDLYADKKLKYADVEELMLPAPQATPDFDCSVESAYTQLEEIRWYQADPITGNPMPSPLGETDVFLENTMYCVEVELSAKGDFEFSLKELNGYINNTKVDAYFPEDANMKTVVLYCWYDTSKCISEVEINDLQYPIQGMQQDLFVNLATMGCQFRLQNGGHVEWLYETNSGTAAAGFAHLDGAFKGEGRRHQVYGDLIAEDGYWFATDHLGRPIVKGLVAGEDFAWTYTEDTMTDGTCSHLAFARTFELPQSTGSIYLGGFELKDGEYLMTGSSKTTTEKPDDSYAYYKNNKLLLQNYSMFCDNEYSGIEFYEPLTIVTEGDSLLITEGRGINALQSLTFTGDGNLALSTGNGGILSMYSILLHSGNVTIADSSTIGGIWMINGMEDTLTMSGGNLFVGSNGYGINSDDQLPIVVNGGNAYIYGECGSVYWEELTVKDGTVQVNEELDPDNMSPWDGVSRLVDYKLAFIQSNDPGLAVMPYVDVSETDWFYDAVYYNYIQKTMTGMDATHFDPYGQLSRAQFALILYRIEGTPFFETEKTFGDISGDEWYGPAVLWAAENGIVTGYQNGNFGPADMITREQMALMMFRYAKYLDSENGVRADISGFLDAGSVSGFALEAMQWANGNGIITGKDSGTKLDPQGNTARAEAAAIIQRFMYM